MAAPMVTANSWSSRPTIPPMKSTGMKTAARDRVMERMVKPISREPSQGRLHRRLPHLHVADDVLQHHDGVVHHETHREGQRHQGEVVQAEAQQVHHREGPDQRHRQRQAGDHGGREVPQEEEDHQHHQDQSVRSRVNLHVVHRVPDGLGAVEEDVHGSPRPAAAPGRWQQLPARPATRRRCWCPGWRWMARTIARWSSYQAATLSFSTLSRTLPSSSRRTGRAVPVGDDQRPVGRRVLELARGLDGEGLVRPVQGAGGQIDVAGAGSRSGHLVDADAAGWPERRGRAGRAPRTSASRRPGPGPPRPPWRSAGPSGSRAYSSTVDRGRVAEVSAR